MMLNRGQQQGIDDKSRVPQLQVGRWMRAMVEVVGAGGAREQVDVYVDPSTETAYEKVRSLADTRMGKAYHYQTLELQAQAQAAGGGGGMERGASSEELRAVARGAADEVAAALGAELKGWRGVAWCSGRSHAGPGCAPEPRWLRGEPGAGAVPVTVIQPATKTGA